MALVTGVHGGEGELQVPKPSALLLAWPRSAEVPVRTPESADDDGCTPQIYGCTPAPGGNKARQRAQCPGICQCFSRMGNVHNGEALLLQNPRIPVPCSLRRLLRSAEGFRADSRVCEQGSHLSLVDTMDLDPSSWLDIKCDLLEAVQRTRQVAAFSRCI